MSNDTHIHLRDKTLVGQGRALLEEHEECWSMSQQERLMGDKAPEVIRALCDENKGFEGQIAEYMQMLETARQNEAKAEKQRDELKGMEEKAIMISIQKVHQKAQREIAEQQRDELREALIKIINTESGEDCFNIAEQALTQEGQS